MSFVVALPLALLGPASADTAGPGPKCEAHFFPSEEVNFATRLGGAGLIYDLTEGSAPAEEDITASITQSVQLETAHALIRERGLLDGYAFVSHDQVIDYKTASKQKSRLTASEQSCYVEIVINYVMFSDTALTKKKIGVHFMTRDFRARPDKPKIRKLGGSAPIAPYIARQDEADPDSPIVSIGYAEAFNDAFDAAIERFWKL